jgi:hypothetical protein
MRGGAVSILCILIEPETGKEYALLTLQPRIPAGYDNFPEIPAGMVLSLSFLCFILILISFIFVLIYIKFNILPSWMESLTNRSLLEKLRRRWKKKRC